NFLYRLELMRAAAGDGDAAATQAADDAALALVARPLAVEDRNYQDYLIARGRALASLGRPREAVEALAAVAAALAGATAWRAVGRAATVALELGRLRARLGELAAAEAALQAARAGFERTLPAGNPELADVRLALGELALQAGRFDAAVEWLSAAESIYAAVAELDRKSTRLNS